MKRYLASVLILALIVATTMYSNKAEAAVSCTNLTAGNDGGVGGSSFTTASISPTSNTLILASVVTRTAASDPNHATITGNGLTWIEVLSINFDNAGSQKRLTVLRALGTASAGTDSIAFAGQTQSDATWVIDQCTGTDTSGTNGSGAIVQTASNTDVSGTGTTLTATLAAFGSANNSTYGAVGIGNGSGTFTAGSGFATVGNTATPANIRDSTEFKAANDTTVDFTSSIAGELGVIGIELKVAAAVTTAAVDGSGKPYSYWW